MNSARTGTEFSAFNPDNNAEGEKSGPMRTNEWIVPDIPITSTFGRNVDDGKQLLSASQTLSSSSGKKERGVPEVDVEPGSAPDKREIAPHSSKVHEVQLPILPSFPKWRSRSYRLPKRLLCRANHPLPH